MEKICSNCKYDCTATAGYMCPECGRAVIITRAQAALGQRLAYARAVRVLLLTLISAIAPGICLIVLIRSGDPLVLFGLFAVLMTVSPGVGLLVATLLLRPSARHPTPRQETVQEALAIFSWGWIAIACVGYLWWFFHMLV